MSGDKLVIPPPRSDRPPLHSNAFDVAQGSNTQLKPLFPYLHPGAMVPHPGPADAEAGTTTGPAGGSPAARPELRDGA